MYLLWFTCYFYICFGKTDSCNSRWRNTHLLLVRSGPNTSFRSLPTASMFCKAHIKDWVAEVLKNYSVFEEDYGKNRSFPNILSRKFALSPTRSCERLPLFFITEFFFIIFRLPSLNAEYLKVLCSDEKQKMNSERPW